MVRSRRSASAGARAARAAVLALALALAAGSHAQDVRDVTPLDVANGTYRGVLDDPVTLVAGRWEGAPFEPGGFAREIVTVAEPLTRFADLDGDGHTDALVALLESGGGTGHFLYLAALMARPGGPENVTTLWIGDRIPVRSLAVDASRITLQTLQEGPGDAACCKGQKIRQVFELQGGSLVQTDRRDQGRISVRDLEGRRWVLVALDDTTPALPSPTFTLRVQDGRFEGDSGCNDVTASFTATDGWRLQVAPPFATRNACAPLVRAQEEAVLARLPGVSQFTFVNGRLGLFYVVGDVRGTLLFRDASADAGAR